MKRFKSLFSKKNTMNTKTYYQIILDASGSMSDGYEATLGSLNEQIAMIKKKSDRYPDEEFEIGIVDFSEDRQIMVPMQSPEKIKPITAEQYQLRSSTALWDAIGFTVENLSASISKEIEENKASAVVVVLTDGHENASNVFGVRYIGRMIQELERTNLWQFSFIGADLDINRLADGVGIESYARRSYSKHSGVFESRVSNFAMDILDRQSALKRGHINDKSDWDFNQDGDSDF